MVREILEGQRRNAAVAELDHPRRSVQRRHPELGVMGRGGGGASWRRWPCWLGVDPPVPVVDVELLLRPGRHPQRLRIRRFAKGNNLERFILRFILRAGYSSCSVLHGNILLDFTPSYDKLPFLIIAKKMKSTVANESTILTYSQRRSNYIRCDH